METTLHLHLDIKKEQEGSYFELPFPVPQGVCRIDIAYDYPRRARRESGGFVCSDEVNIVDLSLCGPQGCYLGSSGSDRKAIYISGFGSAQGYARAETVPGEWRIIVGAYKVQPGGVGVDYTVTFTPQRRALLRGDTHVHTKGSDGYLPAADTARAARDAGLDYLFITDHNNYAHNFAEIAVEGLTVLPGMEWTHYKGHAGMLGIKKPYEGSFYVNTADGMRQKLAEARENGAMVVLNHPFCPYCGWKWGMEATPYDAVELWNGPWKPDEDKALAWWQGELCAGRRIPVLGGSDFHRPEPLRTIGTPCTGVWALSRSPRDILAALRAGHSYIAFCKDGPGVDAPLGETVDAGEALAVRFFSLRGGDLIRLVSDTGEEAIPCPDGASELSLTRRAAGKFLRFEVRRSLGGGLPPTVAMVSNPVYIR